jgi:hypothetical protein
LKDERRRESVRASGRRNATVDFAEVERDKSQPQDAKPAAKSNAPGDRFDTDGEGKPQEGFSMASNGKAKSDLWALEGVRSLPFDFVGFQDAQGGDLLALRSLGHEPSLELTLVDQRRLVAFAWGVALLIAAWGVARTGRPFVSRLTWLAVGFLLVTALPVVAPWNHEIGTVADYVLGALLCVAAWYLLAGSVGWVRNRCMPRATTASLMIVIGLLSCASQTAFAQPTSPTTPSSANGGQGQSNGPAAYIAADLFEGDPRNPPGPPVAIPDDVVIIPYDHDDALGTKKANRIFVPYDKYVELWNLANPDRRLESRPLPAAFAWAGAEYSATLSTADDITLTGRLRLNVFADAPQDVPLALAGAVFTSATIDGKPAQIRVAQLDVRPQPVAGQSAAQQAAPQQAATQQAATPQARPKSGKPFVMPSAMVVLTVSGKGEKLIEITVRMRQTSRGGLRLLQGQLPTAPATQLRLTVPDAKSEVAVANGVETLRFETKKPAEVLETALRASGHLSIQWRPQVAMGEVDRSLTSQSDAEIDVREDAIRVTWRATLEFRGGQRDGFTFLLPAGYLLERVVGENVRGWTSRPDDQMPRVDVTLLKPATDREQVTLVLSRRRTEPLANASSQALPTVTPEGAALQQGIVAIRRSPLLDVRVDEVRGLSRAELPGESISESTRVAEVNPLGMRAVEALRFQTGSYAATLKVSPLPATVNAEVHSVLRLDARHANYEAQVILRVPGLPLHQVRLELPPGFELEQLGAPQPSEWSVRAGEQGQQELTLLLGVGQKGMFQVSVRGRLPRKAGEPLPLPRIGVPGAATVRGDLVVQVDPSVDVKPEELQGCEPVLLASTHGWLTESQRPLARLALRHQAAQYSGRLVLAPRQPRVSSFTVTNVKVTGRSIAETVLIELKIEEAGIREVLFTLPKSLATARISAPLLRQKKIEPVPAEEGAEGDSRVRVRLALQDEVMGVFRVLIEHDRLLTTETQEAPLPVVETGRTDQRFVTVESTSLDEVVVNEPEGFESITRQQQAWGRLTSIFGENLLQAYVVKADATRPRLAYRTQTRSTVETVGARIALSETDLVVDAHGAYRAKQTYHVDNGTEQFLVVQMPEGAKLWTALVAGEPVRPQEVPDSPVAGMVRIPLVKTAAGDLDYPVVLTYGGKMPEFGIWSPVRFPFLKTNNINVELSRVRLRLPETHRWLQFDGTLGRVEEQGEYEASWLDYQTRRFQRLMDTLATSESDSLARMRSQSNLKQLGRALQKYSTGDTSGNSANLEYSRNLSLFNSTLEQAQQSVEKEETEQLELQRKQEFDNRDRLNDLFERQRNSRASNVATQLGANFYYAPQAGPASGKASGGAGQFDSAWFAANGLRSTAPMNRVIMNETRELAAGESKAGAPQQQADDQVQVLRGELGKRLSSQVDQVNPNANGDRSRRAGRKEADGEVRQRYQIQLEQQSQGQLFNAPINPSAQNGIQAPNTANALPMEPQAGDKAKGDAAAPVVVPLGNATQATPEAPPIDHDFGMLEAADIAVPADGTVYLKSLDVELPAGGVEYLFRTPRGDLEITAYSVSAPLLERVMRLGVVLLVVLVLVVPARWLALAMTRKQQAA